MADNNIQTEENQIIHAIKSGAAKMRPRWYFVLRGTLIVLACVLTLFLLLLAVSFIVFALNENGGFLAAGIGFTGWSIFFRAFPWSILLLSLALALILVVLLKRYAFIYQRPALYLLLMLAVVIGLGTFFIRAIKLHYRIEADDIPVIHEIYQYETAPQNYIYRGKIIELISNGFIIEDNMGITSTVRVASGTVLNLSLFKIGDFVMIFGESHSTATIDVYGIQSAYAPTVSSN